MADELFEEEFYTLTDEDGNENQVELLGSQEINGITYLALLPTDDKEGEEYFIFRLDKEEDGEEVLITIEDDDEFEKVAAAFDDLLFADDGE